MKENAREWLRPLLFAAVGAALGYLYYRTVGCASGSCPITSSPVSSMLYVGFLGLVLSGAFGKGCGCCGGGSCELPEDKN